ncbi:hypothetical protein H9L14_01985 [Sphingomonas sediminicola]|uniref:Uncharacterized protein n=1 Tax=Sphingomonas sediminicola TaxID=386874 RepID=A0ABX6T895_9SPHN|nr:hypothetical protein [Sphingomonas sediminicola]QNP46067.1 hypothetical protein H9L14_01985 [Sphingomonas sediminicola]
MNGRAVAGGVLRAQELFALAASKVAVERPGVFRIGSDIQLRSGDVHAAASVDAVQRRFQIGHALVMPRREILDGVAKLTHHLLRALLSANAEAAVGEGTWEMVGHVVLR